MVKYITGPAPLLISLYKSVKVPVVGSPNISLLSLADNLLSTDFELLSSFISSSVEFPSTSVSTLASAAFRAVSGQSVTAFEFVASVEFMSLAATADTEASRHKIKQTIIILFDLINKPPIFSLSLFR